MAPGSGRERFIVLLIIFICLLSAPAALLLQHRQPSEESSPSESSFDPFLALKDRLLVVKLNGMIADKEPSFFFSELGTASTVKKDLHKALKDKHVKAVLLRINSPGGTVATSQEIYQAVHYLREAGKIVVASMGDLAASGGYYVACAADKIVAEPGTLTGSIGVIMNHLNLRGIEEKLGVQAEVIKSGAYKDAGSIHHALSEQDKALFQAIVLDSYDQFVSAVSLSRKMSEDVVRKLADGRIYSGRQAIKVGLIDQLGGYEDALNITQKLVREKLHLKKDLPVDEGHKWTMFSDLFESSSSRFGGSQTLPVLHEWFPWIVFQKQPLWLWQ